MLHVKQFPKSDNDILHYISILGDTFDYFGEVRQRTFCNKSFLDIIKWIDVSIEWVFMFKLEQYRCDLYHQKHRLSERVDRLCLVLDDNGKVLSYGDIPSHYQALLDTYNTEINRIEDYQHYLKTGFKAMPSLTWSRPVPLTKIVYTSLDDGYETHE